MVPSDEKDYRFGKSANTRIADAQAAIREAVGNHKDTFGALRAETRLSRTALAANLKKMYKEEEIDRKTDSEDYRVTHYSLTDKGLKRLGKQKTLQTLQEMETTSLGDLMGIVIVQMAGMLTAATGVTDLLQHELGKDTTLSKLTAYEQYLLEECLTGNIQAIGPENKKTDYFEPLKEFLTKVKLVAENKDINIDPLKHLCNISFTFELKREKLIEVYEKLKGSETPH